MSLTTLEKSAESVAREDAAGAQQPDASDTAVYYKLRGFPGWSSRDLEAARVEAGRFEKSGRPRPRIIKVTETLLER